MSKIIKLIFISLAIFSLVSSFSCKKEEDICYSCEALDSRGEPVGGSGGGFFTNPDSTTSVNFCGTDEEVADKRRTYVSLGYSCTKD